jgi:HEPN domain-containing protein
MQRWILLAEEDIKTAQVLLNNLDRSRHALFHLHQAAEKMLKALLSYHGHAQPRIHDLRSLALASYAPEDILRKCHEINSIYQETRYTEIIRYSPERYDHLVEMSQDVIEWARNEM